MENIGYRQWLWSYLKFYKWRLFAAFVSSLLLAVVSVLMVIFIGPILGKVFSNGEAFAKHPFILVLKHWFPGAFLSIMLFFTQYFLQWFLLLGIIKMITTSLNRLIWGGISEKVSQKLRFDVIQSFLYHSPETSLENPMNKNIVTILSQDIRSVHAYMIHFLGNFWKEIFQIIFIIISMLILSWPLFFIFFIIMLPSWWFVRSANRKLRKRSQNKLMNYSKISEWLQQRFLGIETIKFLRTEELESVKITSYLEDLNKSWISMEKTQAIFTSSVEGLAMIAFVLVLYIVTEFIHQDIATGAVLISFFACLALLLQNIHQMTRYLNIQAESKAAFRRILEVFQSSCHKPSPIPLSKRVQRSSRNCLICQNVSVSYKTKRQALENVSYHFEAGKIYGIVGASGAGKSTFFKAILGLLRLETGRIILEISRKTETVLPLVYLPQNPPIIPTTLAKNICYPDLFYPKEELLWEALEAVCLVDRIRQFPMGLQTELTCGTKMLSRGEQQRLALARAFYQKPPFVLVDEGTSALDYYNERFILSSFSLLKELGHCILMIAHRQNTIDLADEVLVFESGKILS